MKEEILDIAKKLYHNHLTPGLATDLLLRLFDVSGNEAIPKENKKESEVVLIFEQRQCPVCKTNINVEDNYCSGCGQKFKWQ